MLGYLREFKNIIFTSFFIIRKREFLFLFDYLLISFLSLFKINRLIDKKIIKISGKVLSIPYNYVAFCIINEIFIFELYKRLHSLNHILDLGGYIGDSAIYLSNINKKVTVIESDEIIFRFLEKNVKGINNINSYNKAVVANTNKEYYLNQDNIYWGTVASGNKNTDTKKIDAIGIKELLMNNDFDGLKLDIEGGEYELIKFFISENNFPFKKGFIEFHFNSTIINEQIKEFKLFIEYISKKGYIFDIFDNSGILQSNIDFIDNLNKLILKGNFINLYFESLIY